MEGHGNDWSQVTNLIDVYNEVVYVIVAIVGVIVIRWMNNMMLIVIVLQSIVDELVANDTDSVMIGSFVHLLIVHVASHDMTKGREGNDTGGHEGKLGQCFNQ